MVGKTIDAHTEYRIARLLSQQCSVGLASRIVGVDYKTVKRVRRDMKRVHAEARNPQVAPRDVTCRQCGDGHADPVTELCRWCADPLVKKPEPTAALPGTEDKMAVLAERIRRRQRLWCDGDGKRKEPTSD